MTRENGERYQRFFENVPIGLYQTTPDGQILDVNPALLEMLGYDSLEQIQKLSAEEIYVNPADRQAWRELVEKGDEVRNFEMQFRRADGTPIWVRDNVHVVFDADGKALFYEGSLEDITDRKQAEESLKAERTLLRTVVDSIPDIVYAKDTYGRYILVNSSALNALSKQSFKDVIGKTESDLFAGDEVEKHHAEEQTILSAEEPSIRREEMATNAGGEPQWYSINKVPLKDSEGQIAGLVGIIRDITARKRAENAMQESEAWFRKLFELSPDAIMLIDPHNPKVSWPIIDCNEAACQINGYTRDELIGHTIDILHESAADPVERAEYYKRLRLKGTFKGEAVHRHKDGTLFPIMYSTSLITIGDRELVLGIDRDITERKKAEAAMQEQRRSLHMVISSMPNLLIKIDEKDRLSAFAAPPHFTQFLKPSAEPVGKPIADMLPSDATEKILEAVVKARNKGQSSVLDYASTVDDKPAYFAVKISPVSDSHEVLIVADNVTDRKLAELAEHDQRLLAEVLRDIAMLLNSTLEMDEVLNRILTNLEKVVPYDASDIMLIDHDIARMVGMRGYAERGVNMEVLSAQHRIADISNFTKLVATGKPLLVSDTASDPGWVELPETSWIRSYIGAPIIVQGEVIGFINVDSITPNFYTARHVDRLEAVAAQAATAIHNAQLYQSIQQQAVELETANRELEAFSHTVAHDLKAPLQVSIGYASVLEAELADKLDDDAREMLSEVKNSSFRMESMIESLLLLAKLRDVDQTISLVEMNPVVEGAVARFQDQIKARGFQIDIADNIPPALGYGPWIEEVFANLIGNAIKYTSKDNPAPCIQIRGVDQRTMVRYEVQDNGLGIAPKDQARLFEMFSRFHTDQAQGFGLGLSIVQRVVTRLYGQAGADSEPGKGSTFWFTLRKPAPSATEQT